MIAYYLVTAAMLLINSISDMKTRKIDSRYNYFAMGATFIVISILQPTWLQLIGVSAVTVIITFCARKFMADGDYEALAWIILFLGSLNWVRVVIFLGSMTIITCIVWVAVKATQGKGVFSIPYYPVMLGAYILSIIL